MVAVINGRYLLAYCLFYFSLYFYNYFNVHALGLITLDVLNFDISSSYCFVIVSLFGDLFFVLFTLVDYCFNLILMSCANGEIFSY